MKSLSKTKLKSRARKKTNPELQETLALALKNPEWAPVSKILSGPTRNLSKVNLFQIEEKSKTGDTLLIPGKVLAQGELTKKVRIVALSISQTAREKLKPTSSEFATIIQEIKKNPKFQGIQLIK
jgi:large subunit ribosomal protein L18e